MSQQRIASIHYPTIKRVLIARCNYKKAYPVIESLKKAGYIIFAGIDNDSNVLLTEAFSRHVDCIVRVANPNVSENVYIASIVNNIKKYKIDVVVPIGFIDFLLCSKFKRTIEKYSILPIEDYEKVKTVANKWVLGKIAEKIGIKYPKSLLLRLPDNFQSLEKYVNKIGPPLVIKGIGDASKPIFVSDLGKLTKILKNFTGRVLLQEFIVGTGVGYFCLSYRGEPLAEFMHQRILETAPLGGASIKACSNFDEELLKIGRKIVKSLGWNGVMMAEFKKDFESGEYYLLEINPKFWGSLELSYKAGVDFPRYLVELFLKQKKPTNPAHKHLCFSWLSDGLSAYSHYGLKTLKEIFPSILPRNPLMSDLHIFDPLNASSKIAIISFSILRSIFKNQDRIPDFYVTNKLKRILKQLNGVILDFDGTIVKLNVPWDKVQSELLRLGVIRVGESIQEAFYKHRLRGCDDVFSAMNEIVCQYELQAVKKLTTNHALRGIFKTLKEKALKIAVVSKQSKKVLIEGLQKVGLLRFIDVLIGREDFVLRKDQIQYAIIRMFDPSCSLNCVMLGDTLVDVKAALQVGVVPTCLVGNSIIKRLQMKNLDISYFVSVQQALVFIHRGIPS